MELNGTKHGVLGQKQFGYLEGTVNADAVALRVVDEQASQKIYKQIAGFPEIRPFDFLLTNAPGLDDTYPAWGRTSGKGLEGFWTFGDWVNGGVWGTVEGRAILMYYRLGKFEDIRRSTNRAMKWAKDFRMDAPWSQRGENTSNPWSDKGNHRFGGVAVMVDNFAIPAATIRGLFDYDYKSDQLVIRPRIPGSIQEYQQKEAVRFGEKKIFLSCKNGGPEIASVTINGKEIKVDNPSELALYYDTLPQESRVEITTRGGWPEEKITSEYPETPSLVSDFSNPGVLPDSLKRPFSVLKKMKTQLAKIPGCEYELAYLNEAVQAFEAVQIRQNLETGPGYFREITQERKADIFRFYTISASTMYNGFAERMNKYAAGNERQKGVAAVFKEVIKKQ